MQIRSECRSGDVKRSWNIRIGHNLEATHLLRVCMHKIGSVVQLWPKMRLQRIFRQSWVTYVQGLPHGKEHQQVKLAQFWIFRTNAIFWGRGYLNGHYFPTNNPSDMSYDSNYCILKILLIQSMKYAKLGQELCHQRWKHHELSSLPRNILNYKMTIPGCLNGYYQ